MLKKLAIIGSGDLGQLIAQHVMNCKAYDVVGYINDFVAKGTPVNGLDVIGSTTDLDDLIDNRKIDCLMIGVGYKHFEQRKRLFDTWNSKIEFATFIHPSAYIDRSASIGAGCVILPGCVLDANTKLGNNVLLNTAVTIAHDSTVGNHSFLSPRVAMAGFINVGQCCNIGINTTIIDNIQIHDFIQTGGGAVVTKNLTEPGLYVGVPAKKIK